MRFGIVEGEPGIFPDPMARLFRVIGRPFRRARPAAGPSEPLDELGRSTTIVVRLKVRCQPGKTEDVMAAFKEVVPRSREVDGVISFDVGSDVADPDSFIATAVFADRAALDRQESLPEMARTLGILGESLTAEPEATIYHVSSSEPHGG